MYYAVEIGPYKLDEIARCWNGGKRGMQKKPTLKYWKLIKAEL